MRVASGKAVLFSGGRGLIELEHAVLSLTLAHNVLRTLVSTTAIRI